MFSRDCFDSVFFFSVFPQHSRANAHNDDGPAPVWRGNVETFAGPGNRCQCQVQSRRVLHGCGLQSGFDGGHGREKTALQVCNRAGDGGQTTFVCFFFLTKVIKLKPFESHKLKFKTFNISRSGRNNSRITSLVTV